MRVRGGAVALLIALVTVAPSGQQPDSAGAIADEILVKFRSQAGDARREAALARLGARRIRRFTTLDIDHVRIPRGRRAEQAVAAALADPDVLAAQPNYIRTITAPPPPNDPIWLNDLLWGLTKIQANQVWTTYTTGSSDVIVADIDTGVKYDHPDLAANMWVNPLEVPANGVDDDKNGYVDDMHGINARTGSGNPMDDNGHGTHTSGTFGAAGNNGIGLPGVNWQVKILACKFLAANGSGTDADAIECFNYIRALKNRGENIRVSNNSWGGYRGAGPFPQLLKDAIDAAGNAGILNIFAAGNGGTDGIGDNIDTMPHDPASFDSPSIVSVASSNTTDERAGSSNFGPVSVDLAAPGVGIASTYIPLPGQCGTCYVYLSGTSMATPHVAGVAALLVAQFPQVTVAGLKSLLLGNVTPLPGWTGVVATGGRLNAWNAALALNANQPPAVSITNPVAGAEFTAPANVTIAAAAADSGGITSVEFFANAASLGVDTTPPFSISANGLTAGSYTLTARATDNLGATSTSPPVAILVNPPPPSEAAIVQAVASGGLRIQQLQNADGGWYFRAADTDCGAGAGVSCPNIIGVTGLGLISAFVRGNNPAVLADAVQAGQLLLSIHAGAPAAQPFSQDLEFLRALSAASGDPQYAAAASTWFNTVTAAHPIAADRADWQFARRGSLAAWDLAALIRSAKAANQADYATALAARIVEREADWKVGYPYSVIGMGSLLWAMHDLPGFVTQIDEYRASLLAAQAPGGTWGGNLQTTAYVALGLGAAGGPGTSGAVNRAAAYFISTQLPNAGWPFAVTNGVPGDEYAMVDSEVARAIDLLYSTGEGASVTVAPAQLAAVTFARVLSPGMTSIVATGAASAARVPKRFTLVEGLTYSVTTTAKMRGTTVMCVSLPWDQFDGAFDRLRILQPERRRFVNRTIMRGTFAPDADTRRLCAALPSLAPISIAIADHGR